MSRAFVVVRQHNGSQVYINYQSSALDYVKMLTRLNPVNVTMTTQKTTRAPSAASTSSYTSRSKLLAMRSDIDKTYWQESSEECDGGVDSNHKLDGAKLVDTRTAASEARVPDTHVHFVNKAMADAHIQPPNQSFAQKKTWIMLFRILMQTDQSTIQTYVQGFQELAFAQSEAKAAQYERTSGATRAGVNSL